MQHPLISILRRLTSDANTHSGFRVLIAMSCTFIPALLDWQPLFLTQTNLQASISLCLGVMACAIVEVDENTKDKQKFIATILACFFIAASCVELLLATPLLFAMGLGVSSFAFMMLSSLGNHYSKIGFGAILVAIYTMIGHQDNIPWFEQPLLLTAGALWYGVFAVSWAYFSPNRSLRKQLAQLFFALSRYQHQKAALFNDQQGNTREGLFNTRQKLAILNIAIIARLESSKIIIQGQYQASKKQQELAQLNTRFLIAEQIHERISASQYLYSQLAHVFGRSQILEGFQQLLLQLSEDCHMMGMSINDKKSYQRSTRLKWTIKALSDQLYLLQQKLQFQGHNREAMQALQAIFDNLQGIDLLMLSLTDKSIDSIAIATNSETQDKPPFWKTMLKACHPEQPVFTHAVRISISLVIAYAIQQYLQLEHGFWLMLTVLFVCQPSFSETRKRLFNRGIGTLIGILIGFPILSLLPSIPLQIVLMITSAFFFFNYLRTNYALAVIFITLFVMFIFNIQTGTGLDILVSRILETFLGCLLSVLAITFIFPDWQFLRIPHLTNSLLINSSSYFKQICQHYLYGRSENMSYRETRFNAFSADASLTIAWQNMLFEPRSKQHLKQEIFALVNRCDALVSYMAALASHRHKVESETEQQILKQLFDVTSNQIIYTYRPELIKTADDIDIEAFENFKATLSEQSKLIIEQLQLIAFTAMDIQVLLRQIAKNHQD